MHIYLPQHHHMCTILTYTHTTHTPHTHTPHKNATHTNTTHTNTTHTNTTHTNATHTNTTHTNTTHTNATHTNTTHTNTTHTHAHIHVPHVYTHAVAKRQLVSSPFTSPLLKQPCVREQDEGGDQDQGSGDEMAPPLSLVDLQMDITDPSLPSQAAGAPLHSTATGGAPWWQVPVHSTIAESRHLVGNSGPQTSCADSGIATSSEIGSTFGTWNLSKGGTTQGVWCIQPSLSEDEAGPGQTREVTCHHDNEDWSKAGGLGVLHTGNHISGEQLNACLQRSFVPNPALSNAGLCMGTPPSTAVSHHSREHRTPAGLGTPQGGLLPSKFRAIGTPSRYSDLRLGSTPTSKSSGMSFEAEEVLRKKEALKAKMRFGERRFVFFIY